MNQKNKYFYNSFEQSMQRKINTRNIRKILIVCEGGKTEPNYFRAFPKNHEIEIVVDPAGMVADSVVKRAIELKDKAARTGDKYHKVWCVFDRDDNLKQNFNHALQLAECNKIVIAYSIEAFELWYLLHFEFLNTGISRAQYRKKLEIHMNKKYRKNSIGMYKLLKKHQKRALLNAEKLYGNCNKRLCRIYDNNPSTTVHLLVKELNEYLGVKES